MSPSGVVQVKEAPTCPLAVIITELPVHIGFADAFKLVGAAGVAFTTKEAEFADGDAHPFTV